MIDLSPPSTPTPGGGAPTGILLSRDLIFTSKITGTAKLLGHQVLVAGGEGLALAMIARWRPRAVFVDLGAGDLVRPEALIAYRAAAAEAGPEVGGATAFVAFGSHVDLDGMAAAKAAGCDPVLPRSRFTSELPELIRRHLGEASGVGPAA